MVTQRNNFNSKNSMVVTILALGYFISSSSY